MMKSMKTLAFLALAGVMGMASANSALGQATQNAQQLAGTWLVQVAIEDCDSGTQIGGAFQSLLTFAQDGTLTETTANSMFYPAERGPGHGVWAVNGAQTYRATSMAFITLNGVLMRTQTIDQTIQMLTSDSFKTKKATVKFYGTDGTLLGSGCASATGKRIALPSN